MSETEIRTEVCEDGSSTGVELEEYGGEERIDEPFNPDEIDVTTRPMIVGLIMSRLESHALNLQPEFQRKAGVWDDRRQCRLIESLLLRIPLPSFYASENEDEEWEIVDGIQRLTAIARFIRPDLVPQGQLRLHSLEYLGKPFDGKLFADLSSRLQRRILETEFTFHVIRHGTPELVRFNIFVRINTGGMPLTYQELRHALVPGKARDVLATWATGDSFLSATDRSVRGHRMADREMVLRYLAFRLRPPEAYKGSDLNAFLIDTMKLVNKLDDVLISDLRIEFDAVMDTARAVFGNDAFRKRLRVDASRSPVNKALFEAVSVGLAELRTEERSRLVERREAVLQGFLDLHAQLPFVEAISVATGDSRKVRLRFSGVKRLLQEVLS